MRRTLEVRFENLWKMKTWLPIFLKFNRSIICYEKLCFLDSIGAFGEGLGAITLLRMGFYSIFNKFFHWILRVLSRVLWAHNEWSCNNHHLHLVQKLWAPSMIIILKEGKPMFLFKLVLEIRFSDALLATEVIFFVLSTLHQWIRLRSSRKTWW